MASAGNIQKYVLLKGTKRQYKVKSQEKEMRGQVVYTRLRIRGACVRLLS